MKTITEYKRFTTNDGIKVSVPVEIEVPTVPCAHCFKDCALGEFEIPDGSSVCEDCLEIDFSNNTAQHMMS